MVINNERFKLIKEGLEEGHEKAKKYYKEKKKLVEEIRELTSKIDSKLNRSQFGSTVSEFLAGIEENDTFSDKSSFLSNVNAFLKKRIFKDNKLNENECEFLWILHNKDFIHFPNNNLIKLSILLEKEKYFVADSIALFSYQLKDFGTEVDKSLKRIKLIGKIIKKQKESLDNGNINSFLKYFEKEQKISGASISRRLFLKKAGISLAIGAGALAIAYLNIDKILSVFGKQNINAKSAYGSIKVKGVNYDVGTRYTSGSITRTELTKSMMEEEISLIKNRLHCNAIRIYGEDINKLVEATTIALGMKLQVWFSPRWINSSKEETKQRLLEIAPYVERIRKVNPNIILIIGNEFTLDIKGFIRGSTYQKRARNLVRYRAKIFNTEKKKNLNQFLRDINNTVRQKFKGIVTYAAANWEDIDWGIFDFISVNKYWDILSRWNYVGSLRKLKEYGKPIAITEFGCGSYSGTEKFGGASTDIVDWNKSELKKDYKRDENVQANYILKLLNIFLSEGISATFVHTFVESHYPFIEDPTNQKKNLDTASFNLIKVISGRYSIDPNYYKDPKILKKSFLAISNFYRNH